MQSAQNRVLKTCSLLQELAHTKLFDIQDIAYLKTEGYKKGNTPPETGWQPFLPGTRVRGKDEHFWFRMSLKTPKEKPFTYYYVKFITGYEGQRGGTPQGLVYVNGEMMQGCDANHTDVFLQPDTEYTLHNYFYLGIPALESPLDISLWETDEKTEQLYYDMKVALDSCMLLNPNSDEYIAVMTVLEQTANMIDFREPGSNRYRASIDSAIDNIGSALYTKLCSAENKPIVSCIAHTHIDVEWLWDRAQTREKIQRSFSTAAMLMQRYPEYRFMLSQPELYRYLKEEAPEKYEQLKQFAKDGRWEAEGAMYVEADCNLISGESFVRQILHGKKFFREELGVESRVLFLPDVFGYSAAMPQILLKSGIRHFVTSKISWNDTNTMPVDCFLWQGIDGSEIFTNFITTQKYSGPEPERHTIYTGKMTPSDIKGTWNRFQQKGYSNRAMTTFGYGDGGGGPTQEMLETQRRLAKGLPGMPVTKMEKLIDHLDKTREEFDKACKLTQRTPKWVGELFLEYHRGTYTSMAKNKRANRKSEFALQCVEALSCADMRFGGSYDAQGIYETWEKVLHDQFHDILPGSSIEPVYEGTDRDYAQIRKFCEDTIGAKLTSIADGVAADKGVLVYNPSGFDRSGIVTVDGKTVELETQIPAFGWKVMDGLNAANSVCVDGLTAENRYYKVTLDQSGRIVSLFDKQAKRQVFKEGCFGNEIQMFEDYPIAYDNWEISNYYKTKMWVLDEPAEITPVTDGTRAGFRVRKPYMHSTIGYTVWLYSQDRRIDLCYEIDWHEHHQIMKAAFPLDVHANSATFEIQFGYVQRPTHENTSWDKAKFESYGHKWVDLSENGYGVSFLNDCKYGYSTEGSTLKLTILKCGTYPNPNADQGLHKFTYSILPHPGDFREAGVIRAAYALNQPLLTQKVSGNVGQLPAEYGLVSCDSENVMVETVKKAEADDGIIVRMYEAFDRRTTAQITVAPGFREVWLCDLMENPLEKLELTDNTVTVPVSNFEIITLKFQ